MQKIKNFFIKIWKWLKAHAKIWCILIFHFEIGKMPDDEKRARAIELKKEDKKEIKNEVK